MNIRCGPGEGVHWHDISPTGMAMVLDAIREGELLIVGGSGVSVDCYAKAFTPPRVYSAIVRYGRKNIIKIDGVSYDGK